MNRNQQWTPEEAVSVRLHQLADADPQRSLFTFLDDGETETAQHSVGSLDVAARRMGGRLQARDLAGERVLLALAPGRRFIEALFGCLYAGATPVPVVPPGRRPTDWAHVGRIAVDCAAAAVVCEHDWPRRVGDSCVAPPELGSLPAVIADAGHDADASPALRRPHEPPPNELAFLQYTSGSTGMPKGVMVSHASLAHNLTAMQSRLCVPTNATGVSWLPPYHDMGLIGCILLPVSVGFHGVHMTPAAFLQQPMRWLQAISRYRAYVSGAPDFAYRVCAERADDEVLAALDLSHWRVAFNGAEPITAGTLAAFSDRFARAGFDRRAWLCCYGLAEATLFVSGQRPEHEPRVRRLDSGQLEFNAARPAGAGDGIELVSCGEIADSPMPRWRDWRDLDTGS